MGEWEKIGLVYEAQLAHTQGQEERLAAYYRLAELSEEKLIDSAKTLEAYIRALKEFPLDERSGEEAPRLAATVDGGWETLANSYADILGLHTEPEVQKVIGRRLARTFEDELGDVAKAEETYKYVLGIDAKDTEALANLDRIYLSSESWPELAQVLEMRVQATADTLDLVDLYPRLGELYEARLNDIPNAIRAYRRIFDELDKTHDGAIAALARIYEGQGAWPELDAVYQRELETASGDSAEAEIRAKIAAPRGRQARPAREGHRDVEGRPRPPRRGPGGAPRPREPLRGRGRLVAARRHPRARVRHRVERRRPRQHPHAARAHDERQARSRRPGARRLEPRPRHRLREPRRAARDRRHPAPAGRRERAGRRSPPARRSRGLVPRRRGAEGDIPGAREDVRPRPAAALRRRRGVDEAARRRPGLRGDGRARGDLPRRTRSGPTSSA